MDYYDFPYLMLMAVNAWIYSLGLRYSTTKFTKATSGGAKTLWAFTGMLALVYTAVSVFIVVAGLADILDK